MVVAKKVTKKTVAKKPKAQVSKRKGTGLNFGEINRLSQAFEKKYKFYNGWRYEFEYPGIFTYHKDGIDISFTPEWQEEGMVDIQIYDMDKGLDDIDLKGKTEFKWRGELTEDMLFKMVKKFLIPGNYKEGRSHTHLMMEKPSKGAIEEAKRDGFHLVEHDGGYMWVAIPSSKIH